MRGVTAGIVGVGFTITGAVLYGAGQLQSGVATGEQGAGFLFMAVGVILAIVGVGIAD
jgi:hypothetical protein